MISKAALIIFLLSAAACSSHTTKHGLSIEEAAIMGECHGLQKHWLALTYGDCLDNGGTFKKSKFAP